MLIAQKNIWNKTASTLKYKPKIHIIKATLLCYFFLSQITKNNFFTWITTFILFKLIFYSQHFIKTSLLHRLQTQTLTKTTPAIDNIHQFTLTDNYDLATGSEFHPRDESEKNYCGFLGPSWCNKKGKSWNICSMWFIWTIVEHCRSSNEGEINNSK